MTRLSRLLYLDLPAAERQGRFLPFNVLTTTVAAPQPGLEH